MPATGAFHISGQSRSEVEAHQPLRHLLNAERPDRGDPRPRALVSPPRAGFLPPTRKASPHIGRTGEAYSS